MLSSDLLLILLEESVPEHLDDLHWDCVKSRTDGRSRRLLQSPLLDLRRNVVCQMPMGVRLLPFGVLEEEALLVADASHQIDGVFELGIRLAAEPCATGQPDAICAIEAYPR